MEPAPPADTDAEGSVIGSILIDPEAIARIGAGAHLLPGDFYREVNAWVYGAALRLHERGNIVNVVTLCHELGEERTEQVGGPAYLSQLIAQTPSSAGAVEYASIVVACAERRQLIQTAADLTRRAYKGEDVEATIAVVAERLAGLHRNGAALELKTWADVERVVAGISWEWYGWLPRGLLTMLAAEQEGGKSALGLRVAACYIMGLEWPDGTPFRGETGAVLWCESESAQGMNVGRASKWDVPREMIYCPLKDPLQDVRLDDPAHRVAIKRAAQQPDVRLIIADSLKGASRSDENTSAAADAAFWLASLARDVHKPVLLIHHLRKKGMNDSGIITLDRLRGHGSITQAARVVWGLDIPDPEAPEDRRLSVIKSNLGPKPKAIGMGIDDNGIFFGRAPQPPKVETQQDRACDLLLGILAGGGLPQSEVETEAKGAGLSWSTVVRAKQQLHIISRHESGRGGSKGEGRWMWYLPSRESDNK